MKPVVALVLLVSLIAFACNGRSTTQPAATTPTSLPVRASAISTIRAATPTLAPDEARLPCADGQGGPRQRVELGDERWLVCDAGNSQGIEYKWIYYSSDRGGSWELRSVEPSPRESWQASLAGAAPPGIVTSFTMTSSVAGWMGTRGPGPNLWRTQDGGKTWTPVAVARDGEPIRTIDFSDEQHATLHSPTGLWVTSDGGDDWIPIAPTPSLTATPDPAGSAGCPPSTKAPLRLSFRVDDQNCWMIWNLGASGGTISSQQLFRSDDGGQTWLLLAEYGFESVLTKPINDFGVLPGPRIEILLFLTPDVGWIGTDEPGHTLFSTDDGGSTWTASSLPDQSRVSAIECDDIENCTVTMRGVTWTTTDGGGSWSR